MLVYTDSTLKTADVRIPKVGGILGDMDDDVHAELVEYLVSRLKTGRSSHNTRITRYARIDKLISTWQKLSAEDTKRELEEDNSGRSTPIAMNLPLLAAHLEDTVSFFAEVFAPHRRDFFVVPDDEDAQTISELARKMNRDTKSRGYYAEVCKTIRALAKYNIGGFAVRWEPGAGFGELASPGNRIESLDMYNYFWDQSVSDVTKIRTDAEWAARASVKNQMWLERKALRGELQRVDELIKKDKENYENKKNSHRKASFYRTPPHHVGLTLDGRDGQTTKANGNTVDWASYGAGFEGESLQDINGFEVIEMFCWLNPWQFNLVDVGAEAAAESGAGVAEGGLDENGQGYQLWRFTIVDACQVVHAERVLGAGAEEPEIPHYVAHMNQDDMKEAQRSVMELLRPFQRFGSFLMNIFVAGARKNIWGFKGVDPSMFDTSQFEHGEIAGWLKSKIPGRDVRSGLVAIDSSPGTEHAMQMMGQVLEVMRSLFPSQAMPAQIASIDRAVKSQVSAVMQGVHRRLHMTARTLDSNLFNPTRMQCYRNLTKGDPDGLANLTEEKVAKLLGSGLQSLNAEAAASELREIIFAVIQNQEAMQTFNVSGLFTFWSQLLNLPMDLGSFVRQQQQATGATPPGNTPPPPDAMPPGV